MWKMFAEKEGSLKPIVIIYKAVEDHRTYLENRILKERRKKRHPRKKQEQEPPPPGATLGAGRGGRTGRAVQGTER